MFARFFIDRPIFAWVLLIVIILGGGVAVLFLPIDQYPPITPPTVTVTASYPGANASVIANIIAAPIEQQVNGVDNMLYMSSQIAQRRHVHADGHLRDRHGSEYGPGVGSEPRGAGHVATAGPGPAPGSHDQEAVAEHFDGRQHDFSGRPLRRHLSEQFRHDTHPGRTAADQRGRRHHHLRRPAITAMRIWLDPDKAGRRADSRRWTSRNAIQNQNLQVAAGQIGQAPVDLGQPFQLAIDAAWPARHRGTIRRNRRQDRPGKHGSRGIRSNQVVRVRDVARVELAAQNYDTSHARSTANLRSASASTSFPAPTPWTSPTASAPRWRSSRTVSRGARLRIVYDTTPFIRESVDEVFNTLRDAVILVAIVVLLFLQDWRAMILPMIDVPVSLIGTFAVMAVHGLHPEQPDAVRAGAGHRHRGRRRHRRAGEHRAADGHGPDARTATIKAMEEITGPILAITLVLSSVFVPCCFLGGITGQFFRQFAVTIAVSTIISAINALTMTPSRRVVFLRPKRGTWSPLQTRSAALVDLRCVRRGDHHVDGGGVPG